jgi:hypothetical protein
MSEGAGMVVYRICSFAVFVTTVATVLFCTNLISNSYSGTWMFWLLWVVGVLASGVAAMITHVIHLAIWLVIVNYLDDIANSEWLEKDKTE